jgi:predicted RNase H-like HicB family nuclease
MKSQRYLIVIEKAGSNFSAYSPDLPGCVATGRTKPAVHERMREAIRMHLDGLREDGLRAPPARASAEYVAVE